MKVEIEVLYDSSTDTNHVVITNKLTGEVKTLQAASLDETRSLVLDYIKGCL